MYVMLAVPETELILSHNIRFGTEKPSLAILYVSALLNSGTKKKKIGRSEAYGKRMERMHYTLARNVSATAGQNMLNCT